MLVVEIGLLFSFGQKITEKQRIDENVFWLIEEKKNLLNSFLINNQYNLTPFPFFLR